MIDFVDSPAAPGVVHADIYHDDFLALIADSRHIHAPQVQLQVDCRGRCHGLRGVGHFLGQLVRVHRSGQEVLLLNVSPLLARLLRLVRLDGWFGQLPAPDPADRSW